MFLWKSRMAKSLEHLFIYWFSLLLFVSKVLPAAISTFSVEKVKLGWSFNQPKSFHIALSPLDVTKPHTLIGFSFKWVEKMKTSAG